MRNNMLVKTEPSVSKVEEKLSGYSMSVDDYKESINILEEEGYTPKSMLVKRGSIPNFVTGIPLKMLADWDPQLDGADVVVLLRSSNA